MSYVGKLQLTQEHLKTKKKIFTLGERRLLIYHLKQEKKFKSQIDQ